MCIRDSDAAWYFQQAYDVAVTAIENPGPFGLQESFWMVNAGPNDLSLIHIFYICALQI